MGIEKGIIERNNTNKSSDANKWFRIPALFWLLYSVGKLDIRLNEHAGCP